MPIQEFLKNLPTYTEPTTNNLFDFNTVKPTISEPVQNQNTGFNFGIATTSASENKVNEQLLKQFIDGLKQRGKTQDEIKTITQRAYNDGVFNSQQNKPIQPQDNKSILERVGDNTLAFKKAMDTGIGQTLEGLIGGVGQTAQGLQNLSNKVGTGLSNLVTGQNKQASQAPNLYTSTKNLITGKPQEIQKPTTVGSDILGIGAGTTTALLNTVNPFATTLFNSFGASETGKKMLENPYSGPIIGATMGALTKKLSGVIKGGALGSVPKIISNEVDKTNLTDEDKQNLKATLTNSFFLGIQNKQVQNLGNKVIEKSGIPKIPKLVSDKYNSTISGLSKTEKVGYQANPYQSKEFNKMVERQNSTQGIDNIKNYTTEKHQNIANNVIKKIGKLETTLGEDAKIYNDIKKLNVKIEGKQILDNFKSIFNKKGLEINENGQVVRRPGIEAGEINQADIAKFNQLYGDIQATLNKQGGFLTPEQILKVRKTASSMSNYDGTTTTEGQYIMKGLRADVDNIAKQKVPGLKEIDANYVDKLTKYKNGIQDLVYKSGDQKGDFRSNIVSIISNLDKPNRAILLKRLEEISPGIGKQIEAINNLPKLYNNMNDLGKMNKFTGGAGAISGATALGSVVPGLGHVAGFILGYGGGKLLEGSISKLKIKALNNILSKTSKEGLNTLKQINDKIANKKLRTQEDNDYINGVKQQIKDEYIKEKMKVNSKLLLPEGKGTSQGQTKTVILPSKGNIKLLSKGQKSLVKPPEFKAGNKTFVQKAMEDKIGNFIDEFASKLGIKSNFMGTNKYENIANAKGTIFKHKSTTKLSKSDLEDFSNYIDSIQAKASGRKIPTNLSNKQNEALKEHINNRILKNKENDIRKIVEGTNKEITNRYIDTQKIVKIKTIGEKLQSFTEKNLLPSNFATKAQEIIDKIANFTGTKSNLLSNTNDKILQSNLDKPLYDTLRKGKVLYRGENFGDKPGNFFTDQKNIANSFGDNIRKEKIIFKNPLDTRDVLIKKYLMKNTNINIDTATSAYSRSITEFNKLVKWAKENGYDGIIGKTSDNGLNYIGNEFYKIPKNNIIDDGKQLLKPIKRSN